jgi:NAD+ diphosphatase
LTEHPANHLASLSLDRRAELREDAEWLAARLHHSDSQLLIIQAGRILLVGDDRLGFLSWPEIQDLGGEPGYVSFLGVAEGERAHFAVSVDESAGQRICEQVGGQFAGLRRIASRLDREQAGLAAYARALDLWQHNHRFCGRCGAATQADQGGFRLLCTRAECAIEHFPRLDPAVIMLVSFEGRCLLGRQASWPEGRYSTLAGFVEPGESLEDAVRREVMEEAGVSVATVRYHSSQPWPFPSSLMLGFVAEAASDRIECGDELQDARWFSPQQLHEEVDRGELGLPFTASVSYRLIAHWMKTEHNIDIAEWNAGYRA